MASSTPTIELSDGNGDSNWTSVDVTKHVHEMWIKAIKEDTSDYVSRCLDSAGPERKRWLLDGSIYTESERDMLLRSSKKLCLPGFHITKPLLLAVAFASRNVVEVFLEHGIDVCQVDVRDNNIIHALVNLSHLNETTEANMVKMYKWLFGRLNLESMRRLLFMENSTGMRPLELAANFGTFDMYSAIFDTKGIYLVKEEVCRQFFHVYWYDVTEYEGHQSCKRWTKSPLFYLVFVDKRRLKSATSSGIYAMNPTKDWIDKKCQLNYPLVVVWAMLRALMCILFFLYDNTTSTDISGHPRANSTVSNRTERAACVNEPFYLTRSVRAALMMALMVTSAGICIGDVAEVTYILRKTDCSLALRTPKGRKNLVVHYQIYRVLQLLLGITVFISMTIAAVEQTTMTVHVSPSLKHLLYAFESFNMVWSMLYFFQLIPFMGHFVIAIQSMIGALSRFTIIFSLMVIPFALSFRRIARDEPQCVKEFGSITMSFYTTFTVMLNMVSLTEMYNDTVGITVVHVCFVFLIAILLLNFLIALFSTSVAYASDHRGVILEVQRLSICWTLEYQFGHILEKVYFRRRIRDVFHCENGRVYVTKVCIKSGEPLAAASDHYEK